jgi:hypothetical protein
VITDDPQIHLAAFGEPVTFGSFSALGIVDDVEELVQTNDAGASSVIERLSVLFETTTLPGLAVGDQIGLRGRTLEVRERYRVHEGKMTLIVCRESTVEEPEAETLALTVGLATDETSLGYVSYIEAVNGMPGAPFGDLTPPTLGGYPVREFSWSFGQYYINVAGLPPGPLFAALSFTGDSGLVTLNDADSNNPGGTAGFFNDEDITYWTWAVASPDVTAGETYAVSVT